MVIAAPPFRFTNPGRTASGDELSIRSTRVLVHGFYNRPGIDSLNVADDGGNAVAREMETSFGVLAYPSVAIHPLIAPPPGPAIGFRSARLALWKRAQRPLRRFAVTLGCLATAIVVGTVFDPARLGVDVALGALGLVGAATLASGIAGTVGTMRIWRAMKRDEWAVYGIDAVNFISADVTIRLTLVRDDGFRFPIKIDRTNRSESLRGMIRPEVWFIGDPAGRGYLTAAGGGEILRTRPNPGANPATLARGSATSQPLDSRPAAGRTNTGPAASQADARRRAESAARRAKWQEAVAQMATTPPPAPDKPIRPPRIPRRRGAQDIKWQ